MAPIDVMTGMASTYTDWNPRSEMVTNAMTQVKELNTGGVPFVDKYGEWALKNVSACSGVPEEDLRSR